ncbi:proteasome assembly chaperone family protein [Candidatus Micrarchaeota archaeon]|nr:proteasome assembly chaperone family protein [Candidatus Micrarchaeota archaeon]
MSQVSIHQTSDLRSLSKPQIILGFPGTGLVGSVAASQIVDSLSMKFGGYFSSADFAPLAAIHNYKPLPAARIHYSEKHNLIVIISEMSIPVSSSLELAEKIFDFAKVVNASAIVSLGGISLKEGKEDVYVISSDAQAVKDAVSKKAGKPIREGATTGVTGVLLTLGSLRGFPITALLAEASEEYLDPKAAANALRALNRFNGINVDTERLDREGRDLTKSIKESMIKSKVSKRKGPSSEEGGSMFG